MLSKKTGVPAEFYNEEYFLNGTKSGYGGRFAPYTTETYYPIALQLATTINAYLKPKNCLVLGCARGYLVRALRENGVDAYGVDISRWAIENADSKAKPYLTVSDVNLLLPKFSPQKFSLTIAMDVLEHIPKPELTNVINETCRVTAKHILLQVPIFDNGVDPSHVSIYPESWWRTQFTMHKFEIVNALTSRQIDGIYSFHALFKRKQQKSL